MQSKDLKAIKDWFYNTKVSHLQDVRAHYFEPLYSLGLIDSKLCRTSLKCVVLDEQINTFSRLAVWFAALKDAEDAPYEDENNTMPAKLKKRFIANAIKARDEWIAIKAGADFTEHQFSTYRDMYQRAQVFYSKPLITISDLGTIAGVDGAPYY